MRSLGFEHANCDSSGYRPDGHETRKYYAFPEGFNRLLVGREELPINDLYDMWTFGALADRLEGAGWLTRQQREHAELGRRTFAKPVRLSDGELTAGML